ncbi:MAG: glycosyltransferase [Muribaculaceae bacterium]|nr:glycosyltransferase [Muribaculaceae bacterium]
MNQPLISIITVTYNAADALRPTMASVADQLFTDYEHIIVDGASTDSTLNIAQELATDRTIIHSEPDNGIYDAMNRGRGLARGIYLIYLNAGDTFHSPRTLGMIANAIHDTDTPGIVYGQTVIVSGEERAVTGPRHLTAPAHLTYRSFADGMVVCHQAMAVLKRITSPYDTRYKYSADYEWVIKCLQHSRHNTYIDDILIDYLDEGATTKHLTTSLMERFRIMCRYYGTLPTIIRHVKFASRGIKRRLLTNSKQ